MFVGTATAQINRAGYWWYDEAETKVYDPVREEKTTNLFPTRSDTNQALQSQKMVRGWKFWIWKVEELYHPCSENNGADQLRSDCEADLRLCFRLYRLLIFSCTGSYTNILCSLF